MKSLKDDSVEETEPELPPEPVVEPEEEVIDIDDSTASGRLSALRREMDSDSDGQLSKSREDLAKRMDSFPEGPLTSSMSGASPQTWRSVGIDNPIHDHRSNGVKQIGICLFCTA